MRNIISKKLLAISVLLLSFTVGFAQEGKQEVSVSVAGGLSTLSYETNLGKRDNKLGGSFSVGYTYFFIENLGLNTGLELSLYNADMKMDKFNNVIQGLVDPSDSELYDFHTAFSNYKEKQSATYINIPLMLQYQSDETSKFYAKAGVKLGIPVTGKYKSSASEITSKGFFHETANWGENQEFMGFGTVPNYSNDESIDLNIACILGAEVGMKWRLKDNLFLYTGAYVDYGVNDIVKGGRNNMFSKLEETTDLVTVKNNSALNSSLGYSSNKLTQEMTDKVKPFSVGIKLALALAL